MPVQHRRLMLITALLLCGIGGSRAEQGMVPQGAAVAQLAPASLTFDPTTVIGGAQTATGMLTLPSPAPVGGAVVTLHSSDAIVSVPDSVTVPEGASGVCFIVATAGVKSAQTVTVTADYGACPRRHRSGYGRCAPCW